MNHAVQGPLEVFHHGAFDVVILAGEEVYVPRLEQLLEGHFGALVARYGQQRLVFHLIQNGLHGSRRLGASLAGQRSFAGVLGEYFHAIEKIPGAVVGLSVLAAVYQVLSSQGFPNGRPSGALTQACPQLGDSGQATCLARSVIALT